MRRIDKRLATGQRLAMRIVPLALSAALGACQGVSPARETAGSVPISPGGATFAQLQPIELPDVSYRLPILEQRDLMERVRSQLMLPQVDDPTVARERAWYARNEDYLRRVFDRASRYLYHIVEELQARDMPLDLALLPIVESAFDPFAYSHGRAAGLWQIIPGTGKRLGLAQNWWYDARRDVIESTRAALDYLQQLHAQFNGDWLLAIAGYNSGEGNVARALRRAAAEKRPTDFWGIRNYLPAETRTYVPRLLAIRDVIANPEEYGVTLPELPDEPYFTVVETGGQIDMALAADLAGIDTDSLYLLNAGVNRWATDPGERELVRWTRHEVKQGETLAGLADKYRTTVAVLREVNNLRSNTIRAGDHLMIPHALESMGAYTQSADARVERQQNVARAGTRHEHVVRPGDTLWSIARRYGVDVRRLAAWNSMAPGDVLNVGRGLVIWTNDEPAASSGGTTFTAEGVAARATTAAFTSSRIRQVTYIVRRGDSLSSIARRFRVSVAQLREWNNVSEKQYLQPGQRLTMYVDVTEQSAG
jgi:membrane-bound lytic murein transglycosylase D